MRYLVFVFLLMTLSLSFGRVQADTPTPTAPPPSDTPTATYTPTSTATPTPDLFLYVTLSSGRTAAVEYVVTAGDKVLATQGFVEIGLLVLVAFLLMLLVRRR